MTILSSEINSDNIGLTTDIPVVRLVLNYGMKLETLYEETGLNDTTITIQKEALGLTTLNNTYFRIEVFDVVDNKASVGLYDIEVINNIENRLYDANKLKQELDNLNYYDGLVQSLNEKKRFLEANDFFFNYIEFLEKKLNGNNFIQHIRGQNSSKSCN